MARIVWSDNERAMFVNTLASYLKANNQVTEHVTRPGWFAFYMQQAQAFFPEERKRRILSPLTLPWLLPALRSALGEQVAEPQSVAEYVRQHLDEVLAVLAETHVVVPKTECVSQTISRGYKAKAKQLRVLVVGCLPAQAAELSDEFGQALDLRFANSDDGNTSLSGVQADYAIGMTSFMSHALDGNLRRVYRARYFRVVGALAAVKRTLKDIEKVGKAKEAA